MWMTALSRQANMIWSSVKFFEESGTMNFVDQRVIWYTYTIEMRDWEKEIYH
jgi:hypothetical protein